MQELRDIIIPHRYNYVGVFLTFACNMNCSYCINHYSDLNVKYKHLTVKQWIRGLNRIITRPDLPLTIQGGEPTVYPHFYELVNGIHEDIPLDILTNGMFDEKEFMERVDKKRFSREAKYASIRFSYHPGYTNTLELLNKVLKMQRKGYSVGVWAIDHPEYKRDIRKVMKVAKHMGIDFRLKDFLGKYKNKLYGEYKYPSAVRGAKDKRCLCKPSELLIAPNGDMHMCHSRLYANTYSYSNILERAPKIQTEYIECHQLGSCNLCDIKSKFNRFQEEGHCSVEIKEF